MGRGPSGGGDAGLSVLDDDHEVERPAAGGSVPHVHDVHAVPPESTKHSRVSSRLNTRCVIIL